MSQENKKKVSLLLRAIGILNCSFIIASVFLVSVLCLVDKSNLGNKFTKATEVEIKPLVPNDKEIRLDYRKNLNECTKTQPLKVEECLKEKTKTEEVNNTNEVKESNITNYLILDVLKNLYHTDIAIKVMFLVMLAASISQFSMYYIIKRDIRDSLYSYVQKNKFYLSEFNINGPIIAGVLATLYSFGGVMLLASSGLDLMIVFKSGAFDAISTTIAGGIFYLSNLLINPAIQREVI